MGSRTVIRVVVGIVAALALLAVACVAFVLFYVIPGTQYGGRPSGTSRSLDKTFEVALAVKVNGVRLQGSGAFTMRFTEQHGSREGSALRAASYPENPEAIPIEFPDGRVLVFSLITEGGGSVGSILLAACGIPTRTTESDADLLDQLTKLDHPCELSESNLPAAFLFTNPKSPGGQVTYVDLASNELDISYVDGNVALVAGKPTAGVLKRFIPWLDPVGEGLKVANEDELPRAIARPDTLNMSVPRSIFVPG